MPPRKQGAPGRAAVSRSTKGKGKRFRSAREKEKADRRAATIATRYRSGVGGGARKKARGGATRKLGVTTSDATGR